MKPLAMCAALAALGLGLAATATADSFTYHGQLQDTGKAANGTYDLQLTLYSAATGGSVLAGPVTLYGVTVKDGNFATQVDFGPMATLSETGWVQVQVKAGGGDWVSLDARSPVAPAASACPGSWTLDGNAGNPPGSYLGTADNMPVWIKANNAIAAYIGPNNSVGLAFPYTPLSDYSTAIGYNANTAFAGSIVTGGYGDATFGATIRDTATNQVILVAQHGVGINTAKAADGNPLRDELTIAPSAGLPAANTDLTLMTGTPGATGYHGFDINAQPVGYLHVNGLYSPTTGSLNYTDLLTVNYIGTEGYAWFQFNGATGGFPLVVGSSTTNGNGAHLTASGIWTNASSRSFKEAFQTIDPVAVLDKLVALPVKTWLYKGNHGDGLHMGPVAEEFAAAFGLGSNDKYIGTVDESGVALAAIQGLNRKVEADNSRLRADNAALQARLDALALRLEKLETRKGK